MRSHTTAQRSGVYRTFSQGRQPIKTAAYVLRPCVPRATPCLKRKNMAFRGTRDLAAGRQRQLVGLKPTVSAIISAIIITLTLIRIDSVYRSYDINGLHDKVRQVCREYRTKEQEAKDDEVALGELIHIPLFSVIT